MSWCLAVALAACGGSSSQTKTDEVKKPPVATGDDDTEPDIKKQPAEDTEKDGKGDDDDEAGAQMPGKFTWFELFTTSPAKASKFYGELFGWTVAEEDMGGTKALAITSKGTEIGLILDAGKSPMPKGWMAYISVPEVDDSVLDAKANGGKVVAPVVDVKTVGVRFAILADPDGATFGIARKEEGDPADRASPGDWYWPALLSNDPDDTYNFYSAVAGYTRNEQTVGSTTYVRLIGDELARAFITKTPKGFRPQWIPLVVVDDPAAASAKAKKLGGKILKPVADAGDIGKIALLQDPQGYNFGVVVPPLVAQPPSPPEE